MDDNLIFQVNILNTPQGLGVQLNLPVENDLIILGSIKLIRRSLDKLEEGIMRSYENPNKPVPKITKINDGK